MTIVVNGEVLDVPDDSDIRALVEQLGAPVDGVAVALNGEVVPRGQHAGTGLHPGDKVEVIRAVGGG